MSSHAKILGRLGLSTSSEPRHVKQADTELQGYEKPQLTPSAKFEPDMENVLRNALNGPSKKLTPQK
ncbi:hypothetical protein [Legionella saoudiensis]|uniref:hypothetical protein n=1 Tax=Legionella saoudiensis TaxID=1750561 RepID=UPI0007319CCB|nr:hypothetical protein [Legionella saoudiensis]